MVELSSGHLDLLLLGHGVRVRVLLLVNGASRPCVLPCAHGPSRAASSMLPYVRKANERTTSYGPFFLRAGKRDHDHNMCAGFGERGKKVKSRDCALCQCYGPLIIRARRKKGAIIWVVG